jgi:hypothetical protein
MALIVTDQLGNQYSLTINSTDGSMVTQPVANVTPSTVDNSIAVTAMDLITSALRLIGVLASGEQPDISDANDCLMVLNQMLDGWNADGLAIFTTTADDYALISGKQAYTLGPGGDFDTNRPAQINSMSVILLSNPSNPIEIPIAMYSVDDWQNKIPVKKVNGSFPQICYDDGGFPLRTLSVWPIPQQANSLRVYSWQPLGLAISQQTLTINHTDGSITNQAVLPPLQMALSFPPGYAEAFRYNLAVRLSAEFAATLPPIVQAIAVGSLARLKTMNAPDLQLRSDLAGNGGYNYKADMFGIPY